MTQSGRALVTGASSGIGRAFAAALAAAGHPLVLVARDRARLDVLADELPSGPHEVLAVDLSTDTGCAAVAQRLDRDDGPVDWLVNAAGLGTSDRFPTVGVAEEERQLDLNVRAVLRLSWAAARAMQRRRQGTIVNIASTAGVWSTGTYAASKAWVIMATDGLAVSMAASPVRVLCVIPGFTATEFHRRSGVDNSGVRRWLWLSPDQVAREALAAVAAGRGRCVPGRQYRLLLPVLQVLPLGARRAALRHLARLAPTDRT